MNILLHLLCIFFAKESLGHGGMFYPFPWHTSNYDDNLKAQDPDTMNPWRVLYENELPRPNNGMEICDPDKGENCLFHKGRAEWGSTNAVVQEVTLDEDMYDDKMGTRPRWTVYYPWSAPGYAYAPCNDGCGVNGLNPCGCKEDACENLVDSCPNRDITKLVYGTCCSSATGKDCPHYEGGKSAMKFWEDGIYTEDNTPTITWIHGESAVVEWLMTAQHRGGYAYRLCKVPEGTGVAGVTEDCFENGHLEFDKEMPSFVFHLPIGSSSKIWDPSSSWIEREIVTTRSGTKPENSEWAKINLPGLYKIVDGEYIDVSRDDYSKSCYDKGLIGPGCDYSNGKWECDDSCQKKMEEDGVIDGLNGKWAFKDYVKVPAEKFPPGKYVLSFRWDSQRKPQVWNSCANIEIVGKE